MAQEVILRSSALEDRLVHEEADPFAGRKTVLFGPAFQLPPAIGQLNQGRLAEPRDHFLAARRCFVMCFQFHDADLRQAGWTKAVQGEFIFYFFIFYFPWPRFTQ